MKFVLMTLVLLLFAAPGVAQETANATATLTIITLEEALGKAIAEGNIERSRELWGRIQIRDAAVAASPDSTEQQRYIKIYSMSNVTEAAKDWMLAHCPK